MDILGKLFGGGSKVKIMRLFLLNPEGVYTTAEVAKRVKCSATEASRDIKVLREIGFFLKKEKGKFPAWQLNGSFPLIHSLRHILKSNLLSRKKELAAQFNRCGKITLLVSSGVFQEDNDSRADLLIVGNNLKKNVIDRVIKNLEAEIGRELSYAVMETGDFNYRLAACDKFIRDILDYPHSVIVDKIGLRYP